MLHGNCTFFQLKMVLFALKMWIKRLFFYDNAFKCGEEDCVSMIMHLNVGKKQSIY